MIWAFFSMALWEFMIGVVKGLLRLKGIQREDGCGSGSICVQLL